MVALVVSDGAQLRQMNTKCCLTAAEMEAVFAAAPRLQVLNASLMGACSELLPFLRNDAPYGPLRVSQALVWSGDEDDMVAFPPAVASHASLKSLRIGDEMAPVLVNALVDASAERYVSRLVVENCELDAEIVPALTRLLRRGSLTYLDVSGLGFPHTSEARVQELCAALRECRSLTDLTLWLKPPGGASPGDVTGLLDAIAALPALSELDLSVSLLQDKVAFGRAVGALLSANLPSLHILDVSHCQLGDEGLAPVLDGLAANTHLRELECRTNSLSDAFERDRLDPALAALAARARFDA